MGSPSGFFAFSDRRASPFLVAVLRRHSHGESFIMGFQKW
ncbi:hypothetical protein V6Z12_A08G023700 [Gossypium hirsutum]